MRRVLMALSLLVVLAGCAEDPRDGVATAGGAGGDKPSAKPVDDDEARRQFAECMRDNGVEMDDPEPGQPGRLTVRERTGDRDKVEKATQKCRKLLPNGGEFKPSEADLEAMREMAKCMRANGVPDFPDPDPQGGIRMKRGDGVDPDDAKFRAAMEKCREHVPERGPRGGGQK